MDDEERFERFLEVLDELKEANVSRPIIVEGRRDVESLRAVGCAGEIEPINSGTTLHTRAEHLAGSARVVILLTDWDKKGDQLFVAMRDLFAANGVRVEGTFRDKLRIWMRPPVTDVESLASYVERNLERHHRRGLDEAE